jgi:DNA-binding MarR family transcriptional regulator
MTERRDLAAMLTPVVQALIAAEEPVLAAHGLTMWGYIVLNALEGAPTRTQAALAQAIGADKTRIIGILDDLQENGFISRQPDPEDRRARLLSITPQGRRVRRATSDAIQAHENRLLASLPAVDRRGFLRALRALSSRPYSELANRT